MSELKFACPVCGQHITADSQASGTQLECPTCFRKIVVPQPPASTESKLILSAARAEKSRPPSVTSNAEAAPVVAAPDRTPAVILSLALLVILGAGVAWYFFLRRPEPPPVRSTGRTNAPMAKTAPVTPIVTHPVPTNVFWGLELTNAVIPETAAAGSIYGRGFCFERGTLQGGQLTLRQGKAWPPDLGVTVFLFANQGEDLAGKTIEISPERPHAPNVVLRWKDDQQKQVTRKYINGYLLKVSFGQPASNRMPGKIYLALPDEEKSFVGGTFEVEIRKPPPPKPRPPKGGAPPPPPPPK